MTMTIIQYAIGFVAIVGVLAMAAVYGYSIAKLCGWIERKLHPR